MTAGTDDALRTLLREAAADIAADWLQRLHAVGGNYLRGLTPAAELQGEMAALLQGLELALQGEEVAFRVDADDALSQALRGASRVRAARGYSPEESLQFVIACKQALLRAWHARTAEDIPAMLDGTLRTERLMDRCVLVLASSFVSAREDVIRRQGESLREVSTPVIGLWDRLLLLPLVGIVDSVRAQLISERLLEAVSRHEAEVTLIDVTGVPVMDTSVARHILKTVSAAEMLGTRVVLTGISPGTAQTMVKLGIDMSGVPTRASLKGGLALALAMTRRAVVETPAPAY